MYYSILSFTKEDFAFIPIEFWIGLVVFFLVVYFLVYKHFTKQLMEKELEQNKDEDKFNF